MIFASVERSSGTGRRDIFLVVEMNAPAERRFEGAGGARGCVSGGAVEQSSATLRESGRRQGGRHCRRHQVIHLYIVGPKSQPGACCVTSSRLKCRRSHGGRNPETAGRCRRDDRGEADFAVAALLPETDVVVLGVEMVVGGGGGDGGQGGVKVPAVERSRSARVVLHARVFSVVCGAFYLLDRETPRSCVRYIRVDVEIERITRLACWDVHMLASSDTAHGGRILDSRTSNSELIHQAVTKDDAIQNIDDNPIRNVA